MDRSRRSTRQTSAPEPVSNPIPVVEKRSTRSASRDLGTGKPVVTSSAPIEHFKPEIISEDEEGYEDEEVEDLGGYSAEEDDDEENEEEEEIEVEEEIVVEQFGSDENPVDPEYAGDIQDDVNVDPVELAALAVEHIDGTSEDEERERFESDNEEDSEEERLDDDIEDHPSSDARTQGSDLAASQEGGELATPGQAQEFLPEIDYRSGPVIKFFLTRGKDAEEYLRQVRRAGSKYSLDLQNVSNPFIRTWDIIGPHPFIDPQLISNALGTGNHFDPIIKRANIASLTNLICTHFDATENAYFQHARFEQQLFDYIPETTDRLTFNFILEWRTQIYIIGCEQPPPNVDEKVWADQCLLAVFCLEPNEDEDPEYSFFGDRDISFDDKLAKATVRALGSDPQRARLMLDRVYELKSYTDENEGNENLQVRTHDLIRDYPYDLLLECFYKWLYDMEQGFSNLRPSIEDLVNAADKDYEEMHHTLRILTRPAPRPKNADVFRRQTIGHVSLDLGNALLMSSTTKKGLPLYTQKDISYLKNRLGGLTKKLSSSTPSSQVGQSSAPLPSQRRSDPQISTMLRSTASSNQRHASPTSWDIIQKINKANEIEGKENKKPDRATPTRQKRHFIDKQENGVKETWDSQAELDGPPGGSLSAAGVHDDNEQDFNHELGVGDDDEEPEAAPSPPPRPPPSTGHKRRRSQIEEEDDEEDDDFRPNIAPARKRVKENSTPKTSKQRFRTQEMQAKATRPQPQQKRQPRREMSDLPFDEGVEEQPASHRGNNSNNNPRSNDNYAASQTSEDGLDLVIHALQTAATHRVGARKDRTEWTSRETASVIKGIEEYGSSNWIAIRNKYFPEGTRTNVQIKDKARTIKQQLLLRGERLPPGFPDVTLGKKWSEVLEANNIIYVQGQDHGVRGRP